MKISVRENCVWLPPKIGWAKLNFDGVSCGNPSISGASYVVHAWDKSVLAKLEKHLEGDTDSLAKFKALL